MGTQFLARSMFIYGYNQIPMRNKQPLIWGNTWFSKPTNYFQLGLGLACGTVCESENGEAKPRFRWVEIGPSDTLTESQKQAISQLPPKMTKRCKSLMRQLICFSSQKEFTLSDILSAWVRIMKPIRAEWLAVLKELCRLDHPLHLQVVEHALSEESFEANVRDYTKLIDSYGKQSRIRDAENTFNALKSRGFVADQVTLTAMINMYSKAGDLNQAEETFEEIKLLGEPLDKRSYGAMIMAYIRAGKPHQGEILTKEMDALQVYAGREIYKALLRAYSMIGDAEGAQRVFNAIQLAGISPDVKLCCLLINAYGTMGRSEEAYRAFLNMRRADLGPSDKCVAVMLAAYEKENKLNRALEFFIELEREGIMVGKESSGMLAGWLRRLGVVEEVELVLREYAGVGAGAGANHV